MSTINERFKELRDLLGFNQKDFSNEVGISRTHISGIENGKDNPSLSLSKLVCYKFGVNEEWLLEGIGEVFVTGKSFDDFSDDGIKSKYDVMKSFLEQVIYNLNGDDLKNVVTAFSNFVSIITMKGLDEENKSRYLDKMSCVMKSLEQITYNSYMLKNISDSNYKSLLKYKTGTEDGIKIIDENIKEALTCYLSQYEKDLKL